jgi:S1-C subfamily serine protease
MPDVSSNLQYDRRLFLNLQDFPPLPFQSMDSIQPLPFPHLKVGERIYVIGFPLGLVKSITRGIVSSSCSHSFQFDASIFSGNGGRPIL